MIIFLIYGAYGLLFSTGGARGIYQRFQRVAEAVFGSMFGLLGLFVWLAWSLYDLPRLTMKREEILDKPPSKK